MSPATGLQSRRRMHHTEATTPERMTLLALLVAMCPGAALVDVLPAKSSYTRRYIGRQKDKRVSGHKPTNPRRYLVPMTGVELVTFALRMREK